MRIFGGSKRREKSGGKTRVTYFLQTEEEVWDLPVTNFVDNSVHAVVEASKEHLLALMHELLRRERKRFVRWWG